MDKLKDLLSPKAIRASIKHWVMWNEADDKWEYYGARLDHVKKMMKSKQYSFMGPFETKQDAEEVAYSYNEAENDMLNYPMGGM